MNMSIALAAPFATTLTSNGSKRAASSSLTIARAVERPSFAVGAERDREVKDEAREEERENDDETASLSRLAERVR